MFQELHNLPDGLLDTPAEGLEALLGRPTLIHLPGRQRPNLFVSVLLHGNETTGWEAMRTLLRRYQPGGGEQPLPRGLSLFIGNVAAAAHGVRRLASQPDFNRVWPGAEAGESPEQRMTARIIETLKARGLFAAVDIHNNTGLNPHYACVNVIAPRYLHLAALFSRTIVYFTRPAGVASMALARLCPAVTLECGKPDQPHGLKHALDYLDACLHLSEHPDHPIPEQDITVFHTVARVTIPPEIFFGFDTPDADLNLSGDIEFFNFRELPRGTVFGRVGDSSRIPLLAHDEQGEEVQQHYFSIERGELRLNEPVMPSMLTLNQEVIRQDCLCYLMERYSLSQQ